MYAYRLARTSIPAFDTAREERPATPNEQELTVRDVGVPHRALETGVAVLVQGLPPAGLASLAVAKT